MKGNTARQAVLQALTQTAYEGARLDEALTK